MSKPSTPDFSGISAMTDTLDFVKNLWSGMNIPGMGNMGSVGGMNIPGMIMPTLSVEEINKQISDLKAVESWLTLNMNMLRGTIQGLEVQSATITALKSMSATFNAAVKPVPAGAAKAASSAASGAEKKAEAATEAADAANATANAGAAKKVTPASDSGAGAASGNSAQLANPAIWWNMLQDQFNQAVTTAMASEKAKPAKPVAKAASVEPKANVAPKKPAGPRQRKAAKPKES